MPTAKPPAKGSAGQNQHLLDQIAQAAARGFRYYVYELEDADGVFYVGKGCGRRVLSHGLAGDRTNHAKLLRIQRAGAGLRRRVVAFFSTEAAALKHEADLIADGLESLTNILGGSMAQGSEEAAKARAQGMLERMAPRHLYRAPGWISQADALAIYDHMVEFLKRQIACPTPTSITRGPNGELIARGYA